MAKIAISYRRLDTAGTAGRIFDRLVARYGLDSVFIDVDNIPYGTDFRKHIDEMLRQCDIILAIVGPRWLGADANGTSRINSPADPVRVEIETSLRLRVPLIPVLVDGASMPRPTDLPESLTDFAFLNAAFVDVGRDFHPHLDRLIRSMDRILEYREREAAPVPAPPLISAQPPHHEPAKPARPTGSSNLSAPAAGARADSGPAGMPARPVTSPRAARPTPAPVRHKEPAANDVGGSRPEPAPAPQISARAPSSTVRDDSREPAKSSVLATALATALVWYDFYIYGTLGAVLASKFFSGVTADAAFVFTLLAFAAGFAVRPLGAIVFGRLGDLVGRKYAFLVTMMLMGLGTFLIGLLPTYATLGILAPILLIGLRLVQGLALGGGHGAAMTYAGEFAPPGRRGSYTSWVQAAPTVSLVLTLLTILSIRTMMSEAAFFDWGWRIPFLLSAILVVLSVSVRIQLSETPVFQQVRNDGLLSKAPVGEAFGNWANAKVALLALLGATAGEAVVWYGGQFYALFFLTQTIKVPAVPAQIMIVIALAVAMPGFILFGWLSDKIGRKPIMMAGFMLAVVTYFPLFQGLTHYANPALEKALAESPVTVVADPAQCSFQLKLTGVEQYTKPCDVAKSALVARSVNYNNEAAASGSPVIVKVGGDSFTAGTPDFVKSLNEAITKHGYPASANPDQINYFMTVVLLTILVIYVTMVYGPIAAWLVELFPTRIRYTGMSLPYHIGNGWFGGFLPATVFAIVVATGNIYSGLWYPIVVAAMSFVVALLFLPETKDRDIHRI